MEIVVEDVEVAGPHGPLVPSTSLQADTGRVVLVSGADQAERTALGLVLAGRLRPTRGAVRLDGRAAGGTLRRQVAVVDAPGVTEPDGCLPVHDVVAEGLHLAKRRSGRRAVRTWLDARGLSRHAGERFENLAPTDRTGLLLDLARETRGVRGLVLDSPDRQGSPPRHWYSAATRAARSGYAVAVLCSPLAADGLGVPAARIGEDNTPEDPPEHSRPASAAGLTLPHEQPGSAR